MNVEFFFKFHYKLYASLKEVNAPLNPYQFATPAWSGLDSLEELRDIHDAGQDILSKLSTLNSGSKSVGSAERRRAGRDAARLEDHVDQLTQQYHDLLAAATEHGDKGDALLDNNSLTEEAEVAEVVEAEGTEAGKAVGNSIIEGEVKAKSSKKKKHKKKHKHR